jgi:putrescine aminotransferase
VARSLDTRETLELYGKHISPAFVRLLGVLGYGRVYTRASGVHLWDDQGRQYLDALAGFGSVNLGHNPVELLACIREHLSCDLPGIIHVGPSQSAALLGQALARSTTDALQVCMLALSGSEAVDSALKLARAATGRAGFVSCERGYHGLDLGTLSVMGTGRIRAPFEPLLPHCERVAFGDLNALERALAPKKTAAFVVEPVLGEGGAVLAPAQYLSQAQQLCRRYETLFVLDEVQTGLGRTGSMWAFQNSAEKLELDVLVVGKALGAGLLPVSAAITTAAWNERAYGRMDRFDLQGSTYAGYALGACVGAAVVHAVASQNLAQNAQVQGQFLRDALAAKLAGHPMVRAVRGAGLLIAIELGSPRATFLQKLTAPVTDSVSTNVLGQWLAVRLLEAGIIAQPASQQWNVLKLTPPLTITRAQCEQLVAAISEILGEYSDPASVLRDAAMRVGAQWKQGWQWR